MASLRTLKEGRVAQVVAEFNKRIKDYLDPLPKDKKITISQILAGVKKPIKNRDEKTLASMNIASILQKEQVLLTMHGILTEMKESERVSFIFSDTSSSVFNVFAGVCVLCEYKLEDTLGVLGLISTYVAGEHAMGAMGDNPKNLHDVLGNITERSMKQFPYSAS